MGNVYTVGNSDNLGKALDGLGQFCHNWCMNCKETEEQNEPVFRCKGCNFECENGDCKIKVFLLNHTSESIVKYTCMGNR